MESQNDSKLFTITSVIFSTLLVLQILILIIFMIQLSDSKLFRIIVGFCGTGMSVASIVMSLRAPGADNDNEKLPLKINLGIGRIPFMKYVWLGSLIFTVFNLFISFLNNYSITHSLFESSAYTGTLVISTSLLAFIIVGIRVLIKNPAKDGAGFIVARIILLALFFWMFYKIYPPIFLGLLGQSTGNISFLSIIPMDQFSFTVLCNIKNFYAWHLSALIAFYCQYRFYYQWIWLENIQRAQEEITKK